MKAGNYGKMEREVRQQHKYLWRGADWWKKRKGFYFRVRSGVRNSEEPSSATAFFPFSNTCMIMLQTGHSEINQLSHCFYPFVLEGDWVHDQRQGYGEYLYANGDTYTGEWANNKRFVSLSQGCFRSPNGIKMQTLFSEHVWLQQMRSRGDPGNLVQLE